ncbi:MAG: hypothetical protein N2442_13350 [Spirochaetes bacterium]|nr:hypothetical protein [Spirochaetota bacterium]
MNIPLGLALTEVIAETGIPTIAHHHDFVWERQRYSVSAVNVYLSMAFPPDLPPIIHVTINTEARRNLSFRRGLSSIIVPNVFDYSIPPPGIDPYTVYLRDEFGIRPRDVFLLQPTCIIARKGIESAIELSHRMGKDLPPGIGGDQARDEGSTYFERIVDYASIHVRGIWECLP